MSKKDIPDVTARIDSADYCDDCGLPFHPDDLTEVKQEKFCDKCLPANQEEKK